ncbi:hypothetical protein KSP40_PGU007832 [Platanthera guangdongensis]|uniref:Uncharacterized protein n=1 Tax=Platanthera guangdongensis TaxID=2320717 RepID=A0ABR2MV00_9ASPA
MAAAVSVLLPPSSCSFPALTVDLILPRAAAPLCSLHGNSSRSRCEVIHRLPFGRGIGGVEILSQKRFLVMGRIRGLIFHLMEVEGTQGDRVQPLSGRPKSKKKGGCHLISKSNRHFSVSFSSAVILFGLL